MSLPTPTAWNPLWLEAGYKPCVIGIDKND